MIKLTNDEKKLFIKIKERYQQIMKMIGPLESDENYETKLLDECGEWAHKFHVKISGRGIILKYPKKFIKNRGCETDSVYFFQDIHAIRRLVEFVENETW